MTAILALPGIKIEFNTYSANPVPQFLKYGFECLNVQKNTVIPEYWVYKKNAARDRAAPYNATERLFLSFLHVIFVTIHELIHTSGSIYQFHLTGIERM